MTRIFDSKSTTDEVLAGSDLRGLRVFITGVSAGIGNETARVLLTKGANVIGTARDISKNADILRAAAQDGGGSIQILEMDLADLTTVRAVADRMVEIGEPFDLVIENAGVMNTPFSLTKDGFELQFATNFLGHFVLANQLAPLMRSGARLIVLSSSGHRFGDVDLDDPNFAKTPYDPGIAYGRSKTADALFAVAFDARHKARGVRAAAVHPGVILTELVRNMDADTFEEGFAAMKAQHIAFGNSAFEPKTPEQGAATTVWAGIVAGADEIGGKYCENCAVSPLLTSPDVSIFSPGVLAYAVDPDRADALWQAANDLLGERY